MNRKSGLNISYYSLMNIGFFLWIVTEFVFLHTIYSQIGLCFFVITVFLTIFNKKNKCFSKVFVLYLFFLLICYLNIKLGYSIVPSESIKLLFTLGLNFIFILAVYYYFNYLSFQNIIKILTKSALVISFVTWIINYGYTGSIFFRESGGINGNAMAILNAFIISILFLINSHKQIRVNKIYMGILFIFCILAGTRKALLIIIIMVVIFYCFKYPKKLPKYILLLCLVVPIFYYTSIKVPFLYNSIGNRIESLISFVNGGEGDASLITRSGFIELGIIYFLNSPVWGNGINCFKTIKGAYGTYSHNNYIELLFSVGLVGTICYYSIYFAIFMKGLKYFRKYKSSTSILAIAIIISCTITDYGQVVYYDRNSLVFLVLALALIIKYKTIKFNNVKKMEKYDENNYCN